MSMWRYLIPGTIVVIALLFSFPLSAQDEAEVIELLDPDFVSPEYGFGIAIPDGYLAMDFEDENLWVLEIFGEMFEPTGRITIEDLPEDIVDVIGFWQLMKDRDSLMEQNITYEMVTSIADTPAVQTRVERLEADEYLLTIFWVFVRDGRGFTLAAYPPATGDDPGSAKVLALSLSQQFRWMTQEEIDEYMENPPEVDLGWGEEF